MMQARRKIFFMVTPIQKSKNRGKDLKKVSTQKIERNTLRGFKPQKVQISSKNYSVSSSVSLVQLEVALMLLRFFASNTLST